jgi:hypothetical protein
VIGARFTLGPYLARSTGIAISREDKCETLFGRGAVANHNRDSICRSVGVVQRNKQLFIIPIVELERRTTGESHRFNVHFASVELDFLEVAG